MPSRSKTFATAAIVAFMFAIAIGPMSPDSRRVGSSTAAAAAPSRLLCNRNSAFCGTVLRIDSNSGTIRSVAAGAHYGPEWGIPATPNDSTGTGWCVDDTHTGYPAGTIVEQPLPSTWTQRQMRVAATIISLYGGDRVLPYQGLGVDGAGELIDANASATNPTRHRHVAVWLALRSILLDPAGTPRIDLASARTFIDIAGRRPSPIGNPALPLAIEMVRHAESMTPDGDITMSVTFAADQPSSAPTAGHELTVRLTDASGRPLRSYPVWPTTTDNAMVSPAPLTSSHDVVAVANIARSGWLSFDTSLLRADATLTDANGIATFRADIEAPAAWAIEFATEVLPQQLRLFGDDIRAQNNVTLADTDPLFVRSAISGDLTRRSVRVLKTSSAPDIPLSGAVFALIDGAGGEIDRGTTAANGVVDFDPFDGAAHPPPYTVRELEAPPGLQRLTSDAFVAADPTALSADPTAPTVIEISNEPIPHEVVITKTISGANGAPADLSGFEFSVRRVGADMPIDSITTDADGRTPPLPLGTGDYVVQEVNRPEWWPPDQPLPEPSTVSLTGVPGDDALVIAFDNTLPVPTVITFATDAGDGDKILTITDGAIIDATPADDTSLNSTPPGGAVINDAVTVCGLVSGTTYAVDGELVVVAADGSSERTGIVATAELSSTLDDAACTTVDLTFEIPRDSPWLVHGNRFVVTNVIATSGVVVARHDDLDSAEQSVTVELVVPQPVVTTPPVITPPPSTTPPPPPPPPTPTSTSTTTSSTVPPTTVPPSTTTTTTSTTTPPAAATTPPTTTTTAPTTTSTSPPPPPTSPPPNPPPLPRTGDGEWRAIYRAASGIVFGGAALFFASTLGLGRTAMARDRSRRDPSRLPGTHATRTSSDLQSMADDPASDNPASDRTTRPPRDRSRRDPSRLPGSHATRTSNDTDRGNGGTTS